MSRAFTQRVLDIAAFENSHRQTRKNPDGSIRLAANNFFRAARRLRDGVFEEKEKQRKP